MKNILITGCSSGIGKTVALGLSDRGYRVFAGVRKIENNQELHSKKNIHIIQLDLEDSNSINCAVDSVLTTTGGNLDALFNNAAYGQPGAIEDLDRATIRQQFETNVFGTIELTNRIIPIMRRQGHGRIIQNSSVLGFIALPLRGAYNASKFALEGLSDTLRLELTGSNIFISIIEPGPIESNFRMNAYKKFKQNIDASKSVFKNTYANMESRLLQQGPAAPFTLPPEAVLKKVIHALEHPRPKIRYAVTFPTYLFSILRRILPDAVLDVALRAASKGEYTTDG